MKRRCADPIDRLMDHVIVRPGPLVGSPCWICTYTLNGNGYAKMEVGGKSVRAHRVSYEHFVGPIPEGLTVDHLCKVRHCVNPEHLEAVTQGENIGRGDAPSAIAHRTNECKRGHSLADAYTNGGGFRNCRVCVQTRQAEYRRRQ